MPEVAISVPLMSRILLVLGVVMCGAPAVVAAEPITCHTCAITTGNVGQGQNTMPGLSLFGPGFPGLMLEHSSLQLDDWFTWKPGQALDVTLKGSGFEGFGDVLPGWTPGFDVSLRFTGPVPEFTGPGGWWSGPTLGYGGPFSMAGTITGPDFDRDFVGIGRSRIWWAADGSRAAYATFFFAEQPAAVPEPATISLMFGAFAVAAARRLRRHQR